MLASSTLSPDPQLADLDQAPAWRSLFPAGRGGLVAFFVVACLVGLGFSLYTQQIWEDALITLRFSENLLKGDGLVYNKGERVHGFTSPINVLLLALCHLLTGQTSYVATLWLYRVFTIPAFALGGVFALRAMIGTAPRWTPALGFVGLAYLLDGKVVAFSANGMETGFTLLALSAAIYLLSRSRGDDWLPRGLCWTGLMWSRPDGCVYIAALAAAELIYFSQENRSVTLRSLFKSAAVCAILYSPWLLWAWWYYGSPIPQTVIAKSSVEAGTLDYVFHITDTLLQRFVANSALAFRPIYEQITQGWIPIPAWQRAMAGITKALGLFCLLYWLWPSRDALGRACSFCFTVACAYFSFMIFCHPWYYPPVTLLGVLAIGRGLTMWATRGADDVDRAAWSPRNITALGVVGLLIVGQIALFVLSARTQRIKQHEIEDGQRAVIGSWLKDRVRADEHVYLEPLGYIGYFSGARMWDYPGLVSPEVVAARRETQKSMLTLIEDLKPDWVVLRVLETEQLGKTSYADGFRRDYGLVKIFNVNERLNQWGFIPGEYTIRYDASFAVFRKMPKTSGDEPANVPTTLPPPVGPPGS